MMPSPEERIAVRSVGSKTALAVTGLTWQPSRVLSVTQGPLGPGVITYIMALPKRAQFSGDA